MSTIKVDTIKNRSNAVNLPNNFKIGGLDIVQGYTASGTEPSSPATGDFWWDSTNDKLYRYINGEFKELTVTASAVNYGDRGFVFGDDGTSQPERIQYFTLTSAANAADFGDLTVGGAESAACSNGTTAFRMGGHNGSGTRQNVIESWTTSTLGNSSDHGDLSTGCNYCHGNSDGTTGICVLGYTGSYTNTIDQFTMASAGNSTDFGDLTYARAYGGSVVNVATARMVNFGGYNGTSPYYYKDCDYITITTAGNASDFGDLIKLNHYCVGAGSGAADRGLQLGGMARVLPAGGAYTDEIQYIDISTLGNATDAGNLTAVNGEHAAGMNTATHGFKAGGYGSSAVNVIQRTVLATGADATDWGDLLQASYDVTGTSGAPS